jgi:kinesin family member 2/24
MDTLFFEHREYYVKRLQQLNAPSKTDPPLEVSETSTDSSDTAVCVRVRPLSEAEISDHHIQGIVGQSGGIANIYEPRKKINGKPDLNVGIIGTFHFFAGNFMRVTDYMAS